MNKPSDLDDWLNQEELGPGDGLGDDWESAFQEEDTSLTAGEGPGSELFQPRDPSNPYQFTPPGEADLAHLPDLDQALDKATLSKRQAPVAAAMQTEAAGPRTGIWHFLKKAIAALPLVHKLAVGGTILGGLIIMAAFLLTATAPPPPGLVSEQQGRLAGESSGDVLPVAPGQTENTRRKWDFKPFYLPVAGADTGEKAIFLEVDLTLLLVLAPAEEIPQAKKIFLRELIYQYFRQQPLATLRHYALARGEMNRSLLIWLREQWPGAPVETVIFNRYQLS